MTNTESVTRYVVTHVNREGMRTLSAPASQGRFTYATHEEAETALGNITGNNSANTLAQVFGPQALGTFEVRPCPCYPGHFDPMNVWFD